MSGAYFHVGDNVQQTGDHNTGIIKKSEKSGPQDAVQQLVNAITALRSAVPTADRELIDTSMAAIESDINIQDRGTVRRALTNIAGIATMVDQVGVPVIAAVHKLASALGI